MTLTTNAALPKWLTDGRYSESELADLDKAGYDTRQLRKNVAAWEQQHGVSAK